MKSLKHTSKFLNFFCAVCGIALLSSCGGGSSDHQDHMGESELTSAIAVLNPTDGSNTRGVVYFNTLPGGKVRVVADVSGLTPNSYHGFHIHEYGDLSAADGTSTGGHYNPEGYEHGAPGIGKHHAGDLGNLEADAMGNARKEMTVDFISINGSKNPVLGLGIILHAGEDDLVSQPTGNAGARIAQGVIGIANPKTAL